MADIIWRPYQLACKSAVKENYDKGITKQLIVQATGTGKRLAAVNLMQHFKRSLFIVHREELMKQAYDEIEKFYPMNVGIIKAQTFEPDKKVVVASVQTLYNRLGKIDPNTFDLIIIDECFPAGTKVDGMNIEDYRKGFPVNSFNHKTNSIEQSTVTKVMKKKHNGILYDLGHFKCTPNHPIFIIGIGYCLAKEIHYAYICNKMMCYVTKLQSYLYKLRYSFYSKKRKEYLFSVLRTYKTFSENENKSNSLSELWDNGHLGKFGKQKNIHELSAKRIWLLFRKMQKRILFEDRLRNYESYKQEALFRKNEEEQSNVQERTLREDEIQTERKNISKQRREWIFDKTTRKDSPTHSVEYGILDFSQESNVSRDVNASVTMFQGRSRLSGSKVSNRNRWKDSPLKALEILRQTEDGHIEKSWLENIKIYKRTSRSESSKGSNENYVYNLEVKGNNNYFANSILVHNCHHYASRTYLEAARHWNAKLITGWTATPKRLDGLSLTNLFEKIVFEYNIADGIKDGFLAPVEAYQIKSTTDISRIKRTAGDFNQHQLSEAVDNELRNNLIVQKYKQYTQNRPAIAYCVDIQHAIHLRDEFRKNNIPCESVSSETDSNVRADIIRKFRNKEFQVLTNCEILTEGFDFNDVGCVIMARPTQSETLYIQCIGRATRLKSQAFITEFQTDKATILDFVDNTGKLNLVNSYELEKDIAIEDRLFLPAEHKEKLLEEQRQRRERRIKLEGGRDKKIDLLKLPEVKVWDSEKMLEPATEKQLEWLKNAGVWVEQTEYTKLQASELISNLPCQEWQIRFLAVNGYDVSKGAVMGQYQRVKFAIEQRNKFAIDSKTKEKIKKQASWEK